MLPKQNEKFARLCLRRVRSWALCQHLFSTTCCHFFSNFMDSEQLLATGSPFLQPILNYQQPFHFFCNKSTTMLQQLLKQLFLVWLLNNSFTRGGAFPGAIRFVHRVSPDPFQLFGYFFLDWFSGASFFTKNAFWEPKGASKLLQNWFGKRPRNPFLHFPANLDFGRPSDDFNVFLGFH